MSSCTPDTSSSLSSHPHRAPNVDDAHKQLFFPHHNVANAFDASDVLYRHAVLNAKASAITAKRATQAADALRDRENALRLTLLNLKRHHMRRVLLPRSTHAKLLSAEAQLTSVARQSAQADRAATHAQTKALADMDTCMRLRQDARQPRHSPRTRRQILDGLFDALHLASPRQNELESQRDALVLAANRKKDALTAQRQAVQQLASALLHVKQARSELWDARITNTVHMFNGGALRSSSAMHSRIRFNNAAEKARDAAAKIAHVVAVNPLLPVRKMIKARSRDRASSGDIDIFFDGFVTDMLARMAIDKAEDALESLEEECEASIVMQKKTVAQLREEYAATSAELERVSKALVRVRVDLMHDVLG